jgi:hypothetical protein
MKKIYAFAWFVLVAAVFFTVLTASFTPAALVTFSLAALALFYALALWSVITNTGEIQSHSSVRDRPMNS